jgi:hypothetical protein
MLDAGVLIPDWFAPNIFESFGLDQVAIMRYERRPLKLTRGFGRTALPCEAKLEPLRCAHGSIHPVSDYPVLHVWSADYHLIVVPALGPGCFPDRDRAMLLIVNDITAAGATVIGFRGDRRPK